MSFLNTIRYDDTPSLDAFGRLRVSEVTTQIDLKQIDSNLPLFIDHVLNGNASAPHTVLDASTILTTTTNGDYAIAQTKQRFSYQTGKSQQIFMTFANFEPESGATKRIGYFSSSAVAPYTASQDGLFMESSSNAVSINIYKTGSQIEKTTQSNWNVDP